MRRWGCALCVLAIGGCVVGQEGIRRADAALIERDAGARDAATGTDDATVPYVERACDDGFDEDGDGLTDCADEDCADDPCSATPLRYCIDGTCGGCRSETSETMCGDGADEDCDDLTDCADPDCDTIACGPKVACATGACPCASGFVERLCGDDTDDDCDTLIDCADPDCEGHACAADSLECIALACTCPGVSETCNASDDDCNGVVDDGCPNAFRTCCPIVLGPFGSTGGTAFADPCPTGTALIGIAGRASTRLDQLQPICAALFVDVDRTAHPEFGYAVRRGAAILGALHGGGGGAAFSDVCPNDDVAIGMRGASDATSVLRIALQCGTIALQHAGAWELALTPSVETPSRGGTGGAAFDLSCAPGSVQTGLDGRESTSVASLATTCAELSLSVL